MAMRTLNKPAPRTATTIKTPRRHRDVGGLHLSIALEDRLRWAFIETPQGKLAELNLDQRRDLPLANAPKEAGTL